MEDQGLIMYTSFLIKPEICILVYPKRLLSALVQSLTRHNVVLLNCRRY